MQEIKAKPKTNTSMMFGGEIFIKLNGNQIWNGVKDENGVILIRGCITLKLNFDKFKMMFKEIED